ncbi:hypothetical protein SLAV_05135 [Streptomyces lavendulae subsp. lavendulae]|uniref:Uncharacterized protein n=1 Tax=Streptomyces lavendulae subsp. lavendulae TaxID=58340 RepID=A0A2K8P864_STRLA|nr:DUF2252 domain-containing protein [Streptomyces lavendulae]ATZ22932.1 hypothetical protein SLAV_05135 [Streptomyces lavendulae subsp. lavendulae]QUQ52774.1 hypothetical protein SLLC_03175 [Streptomyces lavendulae subsp. lavendulae]
MSQQSTTAMRASIRATPEERAALGKEARRRSPRSGHAVYEPAADRRDPLRILEAQSAARVPELVPIRYGRMTESPFRFYRGAAAIMASDLAGSPDSGITTQLCGDAHLLNFRLLASPERELMFDINDFDETLPGPWEWDVKRLSASFVIAARANGFDDAERARVVSATVRSYREAMTRFAGLSNLDVWYTKVDAAGLKALITGQLRKEGRRKLDRALAKARSRDTLQVFDKLTRVVDGHRRIAADPPLLVPIADLLPDSERSALERQFRALIEQYAVTLPSDRRHLLADYHLADVARKVVGVGSVGTRCWIFLLLGRDGGDPLFLQAKEADESVLAEHLGASLYRNQGERVVAGQRLMQATSDIFLGWQRVDGFDGRRRDFYVRQLRDWKGIAMPETMTPPQLEAFGGVCGLTLARAHARSGDRIAIAAYLGGGDAFDRALVTFAEAYADQNEHDHRALLDAVRTGRLPAEEIPAS